MEFTTNEQREAAERLLELMDEAADLLREILSGPRSHNVAHLEAYHRGAFSGAERGGATYNNLYDEIATIADDYEEEDDEDEVSYPEGLEEAERRHNAAHSL